MDTSIPADIETAPTFLDRMAQWFFWCAFRALRVWWFVRKPRQHGALVIIACGGRSLLIRNSYHRLWSAPGGSVEPGEAPADAASREVMEEIGLHLDRAQLGASLPVEHLFRSRRDLVDLFGVDLPSRPSIRLDQREVVQARWFTAEEALREQLVPHLRTYFSRQVASEGRPSPSRAGPDSGPATAPVDLDGGLNKAA